MNNFVRQRSLHFAALLTLGTSASSFGADLLLQKVPPLTTEQAPAYPENLARYHLGAQVVAAPFSQPIANLQLSSNSEDKNAAEAALLCDDPTVGYAVREGKSTLLISLPKIENVSRISFLNKGTKGEITVATASAKLASDSPAWHTVLQQELSSSAIQANVGPSDAKYIRVTFNTSEAGRIAGFGVYSTPRISDFTAPRTRKLSVQDKSDSFALISYNLSDIHTKARALYVSSGSALSQANTMIDDQLDTSYRFGNGDTAPTAVIDLGKPSTLRRLSAVYSPRAGKMDFYVLNALPNPTQATAGNAASTISFDEATLANMKSVGSVTDDGGQGRASIDFPATAGRYVMVRWTGAEQQDASFALAEVAAFGSAGQRNTLLAANTQVTDGVEAERYDGKTLIDGKTMVDSKDVADVAEAAPPAEGPPPSLPQPPPFTFVPVLGPVSP